jgi:hypothetical protein
VTDTGTGPPPEAKALTNMITGNFVKAVQELLQERGIEQRSGERLGDYVARGLGISDAQADAFLEAVHDGATVEEAEAQVGITVETAHRGLLTDIAATIGTALGRLTR